MRTIIRNNYDPHVGDYHERIIQDDAREKTWLFDCDGVYLDITAGRGDVKVVNELGDSEVDATSQALVTNELAKKQNTLTAGDNITIQGNVISATGGTYTAGSGLVLNGNQFSADTTVLATKDDLTGKQDTLSSSQLAAANSGITSTGVTKLNGLANIKSIGSNLTLNSSTGELSATDTTYTAGSNITISDGTISATDTTYTAGTGLSLNGTEFSVDASTVQSKLTAGSNITITGDTISATDTTYSDFVGATSGAAGSAGLVPAPASGDTDKYLKSDGSWATVSQYSLPAATANTLGGVKIGSNLSMDANDVLSATDTTYTAGTNVSISSGNVISATDTTYSNFVGTDGTASGTAGLVPAPATTDTGKYLKADGTWDTVSAGPTVVQTTGTSTTDVMSQNAVTGMVFADPSTKKKINIVAVADSSLGTNSIAIGQAMGDVSVSSYARGGSSIAIGGRIATGSTNCIAIGGDIISGGTNNVAIKGTAGNSSSNYNVSVGGSAGTYGKSCCTALGAYSSARGKGSVALGAYSSASGTGEINIGSTDASYGYNSSNYRLLTGVYDGQSAHDAATKGQLDTAIINGGTTAPTTSTVGAVGTQYTYVDTTGTPTAHLCVCIEIDNTDPSNPVYTWSTLI